MNTTTMTKVTTVTTTETSAQLDVADEAMIARYNELKALLKELEGEKAKIDADLRAKLGDAVVGMINGVERVRVVSRVTSKIDRDLLKTGFPEAFEATYVQTPYTILQTK